MKKYYYVTTPIYYVNDKPHIGHMYTSIACDILARFKRLNNYEVLFLTGTDEHGQKVEKSAIDKGINPKDFVDEVSQSFKQLSALINLSNDDFIRTTEERHKNTVSYLWDLLEKNGYIYKDKYVGWYAIRDEAFYSKDELQDKNGKLLAPSGAEVEWREEESYFFKLSFFQEQLLKYYDSNPSFIAPKSRFNEVYSFVKSGLKDLSISRSTFSWGIPVPNNGDHVIYVWMDALTNYLSALDFSSNKDKFKNLWPEAIHIVGKDILRFHGVYWPAFLMAADISLPKKIFAHGWWLNEGQKISKSLGNVIAPEDLINKYGLDQVRYFLFKEITFGSDGDFSHNSMVGKINNDLANEYGNLLQRSLSILNKSFNSVIPTNKLKDEQVKYLGGIVNLLDQLEIDIDNQDFTKYLDKIWEIIRYANAYLNDMAPWSLLKNNQKEEAGIILTFVIEIIRIISIYLIPFMPNATERIFKQLGLDVREQTFSTLSNFLKVEHKLGIASPVFIKYME